MSLWFKWLLFNPIIDVNHPNTPLHQYKQLAYTPNITHSTTVDDIPEETGAIAKLPTKQAHCKHNTHQHHSANIYHSANKYKHVKIEDEIQTILNIRY